MQSKAFKPFAEQWKNELQHFKNQYDARNTPAYYQVNGPQRGKWTDETANGLTAAIVDFFRFIGGHFTRVNTMGVPRKDSYGQMKWTPSTTRKGTADIIGVYKGLYVAVEVKIGPDRQSDEQIKEEAAVKKAGGIYIVAKTFPGFLKTVTELLGESSF